MHVAQVNATKEVGRGVFWAVSFSTETGVDCRNSGLEIVSSINLRIAQVNLRILGVDNYASGKRWWY